MTLAANQIVAHKYTGRMRFQERGNRRYLQQQVCETNHTLTAVRYFFEDVPMVDENEQPIEKGPRPRGFRGDHT